MRNSPAGLASRPIRYLLCDEIDRYEATREGDAIKLAEKRTRTFWNRKIVKVSSPTYDDVGIDAEYKACDQQYQWQLECLHCGKRQFPQFKHFVYDDDDPETVRYVCEHCGAVHDQADEAAIKASGEWILVKNEGIKSKGFWCNQWASPFATWSETIAEWLASKGDPEKLQTVINTAFAETWREKGETISDSLLHQRRETYPAEVPGGYVLTAGVDVQVDRLELEVVSWSDSEESWSVDYQILEGDPAEAEVWKELTEFWRDARYTTTDDRELSIAAACIDSGYLAAQVYNYVKNSGRARIWATKGISGEKRPFIEGRNQRALRLRKRSKHGYKPELLGVDEGKTILYRRLALSEVGPGYCHFPAERDEEYFAQLTAEKMVRRVHKGFKVREWIKDRERNEALDCRVLAMAALRLLNPNWVAIKSKLETDDAGERKQTRAKPKRRASRNRRRGFVNNW